MICLSSLPLRGHMSASMNSSVGESISLLNISGNLVIQIVWPPLLSNIPSKTFHPLLSAIHRDSAIGVSTVEKNSVFSLQQRVDPLGGIHSWVIRDVVAAHLPSLHLFRNVQEVPYNRSVNEINVWLSESADSKWVHIRQLSTLRCLILSVCPGSVVASSVMSSISLDFIVNFHRAKRSTKVRWKRTRPKASSIHVVN